MPLVPKKIEDYPAKTVFNDTDLYDCSTDQVPLGGVGYISEKVTFLQMRQNFSSARFSRLLTIGEVQSLHLAAINLLPALTGTENYVIFNPVFVWTLTGGLPPFAEINLGYVNSVQSRFVSILDTMTIPSTFIEVVKENSSSYPNSNDAINISTVADMSGLEATLLVTFDYKIITL